MFRKLETTKTKTTGWKLQVYDKNDLKTKTVQKLKLKRISELKYHSSHDDAKFNWKRGNSKHFLMHICRTNKCRKLRKVLNTMKTRYNVVSKRIYFWKRRKFLQNVIQTRATDITERSCSTARALPQYRNDYLNRIRDANEDENVTVESLKRENGKSIVAVQL